MDDIIRFRMRVSFLPARAMLFGFIPLPHIAGLDLASSGAPAPKVVFGLRAAPTKLLKVTILYRRARRPER